MDQEIVSLLKFTSQAQLIHEGNSATISRKLRHLCILTVDKYAFIYFLPKSDDNPSILTKLWQSSCKVNRLVFSEDGNHVLVLQESGALQVLEVGTSVKTLLEESVLDISKTMSKGNIVWSDMNTVEPVTFCSSYLALLVNHHWLVQLKWVGCQHMLVLNTIERMCVGAAICRKTAYFLTSLGDVQGYSLEDGGLVGNVLQPGKFGVTDPSILTVSDDGTLVGIADKSGNVYLGQFSAHHEVVRGEDEKSVISTSSASSHISSRTTYSSLLRPQGDSASVHSAEQPKRAILSANIGWNSYLTSLGKWRKRSSATRLPQMALVDSAPKGMQVVSLRLVTAGLAVYYTGSSSVYRLFNVTTAQRVVEFLVPSNCVLVAGLPDLDLFLCPDRLWLHLSGLSRELVLAKLIQCLETPSIGQLLIGDELMVPTATLADGLRHHHMDVARFSLTLHEQAFRKAFSKKPSDYDDDTSYKARLSASVTDMERLFDTIYATVRDDTTFSEQLILLCLQHTTNILLNIPSCSSLTKRVMRHITQLREHLYQPNNTLQQSQTYHPLTGLSQKCKECWACWQDLEDRDVLYNAATTNNIPLSQVYLVTDRGWPKVDFSSRFQQELKHWLHCLLAQGEIHHAKEILVNLGMDPAVELHHLFMKSLVPIARDCAAADLLVGGLLLPKEIEAWRFIQTLEEISLLSSQHRVAMPLSPSSNPLKDVSPSSPGNDPISDECSQVCVYTVIRESEHWRDLVMAALYFNTLAPKLKDLVKPEAACICLLRHGRIDFLIGQASLLGFWPLTNTMLDTVICSQGITKRVVDLLLDHHSRYGVFTTKEQSNICSVLTRLARSGCSATMTSIVDFQDSLARFCIKHQLYLLAWRCLDHEHIFSETLSHTHPWFRLYLKYRKLPRKLNSSSQLHDAIISACEYLSAGDPQSYLIAHPLVNVAETLSRGAPFIIPLLDTNLDHLPDVTHYQLLQGTALSRLFSWLRRTEEPPHFCQNQLVKKYGYKDSLSFLHYLNQGRPCFAASTYISEQLKTCGKLSSIMRRQASDLAHGLALQNYSDPSVTAACLCFMEILGISSEIARIHIHAANIILHYLNTTGSNQHKNQIGVLLHGLLLDKQQWVPGVLDLLEKALLQEDYPLFYWSLPIKLSRLHNLALPSQLLGQFSQHNNWLKFLIVADLFQFPKQQVLELCEQFRCSKVKQHLLNSLKLRVQTSASVYSYEKIGIGGESCQALGDLLLSLVHCHDSPDPPQSLLSACANMDNPIFTVFAACYEPSSALLCICTWLATTLDQLQPKQQPGYLPTGRMSWSSSQVEGLIVGAVSCGRGLTLARAWSIFMPDHALCLLFNSLVKCVTMKNFTDSVIDLKTFLAACLNLRNNSHIMEGEGEESFLNNGRWVLKVSISTVNAALIHNFSSLQHRVQFLNALSMAQFPGLDYKLLHQVVVSLLDIDVTVNWASLLEADSSSAIQACVDQLTDKNMFLQATNLCKIVGLSSDSILLAQWSHYFKTHMSGFLKKCDQTFRSAELRPITASRFFLTLSQEADSEEERHQLLTLALDWYQRSEEANICERDNLELLTWQSWLRLDTEVQVPSHSELSSVASLLPSVTENTTVLAVVSDEYQLSRLDQLLEALLDARDIATASRLGLMFQRSNKNIDILKNCIKLAEGSLKPLQLPSHIKLLLTESPRTQYCRRRTRFTSESASSLRSEVSGIASSEPLELSETSEVLIVLEALVQNLDHGTTIGNMLLLVYRIALATNKPYQDVFSSLMKDNPGTLINTVLEAGQPCGSALLTLLCEDLVSAVIQGSSTFLWSDSQFPKLVSLLEDPYILGDKLLAASNISSVRAVTGLLILAHHCYTAACNIKGITRTLRRAKIMAGVLLQEQEWGLLVRLLTGMRRFTDMVYIFHALKENDRFESLLGQGMDKVPGLQIAILDYLERYYAEDKDTIRITALHFKMYSRVATQYIKDGQERTLRLKGSLANTEDTRALLMAAMLDFSQAAQYYLQANTLTKAMWASHQAELVALQISLLNMLAADQTTTSLLQLDTQAITDIINTTLSFPQVCIVARAYNHPVDWGAVLYHRCVLQGDPTYLLDLNHCMPLTPVLVEEVARRFQLDNTSTNPHTERQMRRFVSAVTDVEVKYHVASQLGFRDIAEYLLDSPALPYLKDTVWQSGYNRHTYA